MNQSLAKVLVCQTGLSKMVDAPKFLLYHTLPVKKHDEHEWTIINHCKWGARVSDKLFFLMHNLCLQDSENLVSSLQLSRHEPSEIKHSVPLSQWSCAAAFLATASWPGMNILPDSRHFDALIYLSRISGRLVAGNSWSLLFESPWVPTALTLGNRGWRWALGWIALGYVYNCRYKCMCISISI